MAGDEEMHPEFLHLRVQDRRRVERRHAVLWVEEDRRSGIERRSGVDRRRVNRRPDLGQYFSGTSAP